MPQLFTNNVYMELADDLLATGTTFDAKSGHGAQCPTVAAGAEDFFLLTVVDKDANREIVRIIQHEAGSDHFVIGRTVADQPAGHIGGRNQESTTGVDIDAAENHCIKLAPTAAAMSQIGTNQADTAENAAAIAADVAALETHKGSDDHDEQYHPRDEALTTFCQVALALSDVDAAAAREHLGLVGDEVTTHHHNTLYFPRADSDARYAQIVAGTKMVFYQDTAPTGWIIEDTLDDKMVYISKGSAAGGATGGMGLSGSTWTLSGLIADEHYHATRGHILTNAEMPRHRHPLSNVMSTQGGGVAAENSNDHAAVDYTDYVGGDEPHDHGNTETASANGVTSDGTWRPAALVAIICRRAA